MNYKFPTPCDNNLDHKINRLMIHILVKCLTRQQLLIYYQSSIVDEMNHNPDDQGDLLLQPKNKIINIYYFFQKGLYFILLLTIINYLTGCIHKIDTHIYIYR